MKRTRGSSAWLADQAKLPEKNSPQKDKQFIKKVFKYCSQRVPVNWIRKNSHSWLSQQFKEDFIKPNKTVYSSRIEKLAKETNQLNPQPLWNGYADRNNAGPARMPNAVRTTATMGNLYTYLVQKTTTTYHY